jgi:hypothetical protein
MHDLASNSQVVFKYFDDKGGITENTIREFLREVDEAVEKTTLSLQEARQEKVMVLKIINMDSATLDRIELIELIANPEQPSRGDKRETELEELAKIPLAEFNIMPTYVTRERTATQWDRFGRTTKTKPIVTVNGKSTVIDNSEDKGKGAFGRARAVKQRNGTIIIAKKIIVPTLEQLLSTYEEYSASLDVTQKSKSAGTEVQNLQTLQIMDCHFHIGKKGNMVTLYSEKFDDTLSETLKSATLSEKIELFHEAAKALKQFHETNWVHNDVKPENFLVKIIKNKDNSRSFKVVIADLGLSFPNNSDPTVSTSVSWGQVGGTYPPIEALALREADGLNEDMNDIIEAEKIDYKPMDCFAFGVGLSSLVGSEPLRIDHNDNNESKFIILSWKNDTEKKCREVIAEHSQSKKQVKLATLIFNCIRDVKSRPTMSEIESRMKEIREIPDTD